MTSRRDIAWTVIIDVVTMWFNDKSFEIRTIIQLWHPCDVSKGHCLDCYHWRRNDVISWQKFWNKNNTQVHNNTHVYNRIIINFHFSFKTFTRLIIVVYCLNQYNEWKTIKRLLYILYIQMLSICFRFIANIFLSNANIFWFIHLQSEWMNMSLVHVAILATV